MPNQDWNFFVTKKYNLCVANLLICSAVGPYLYYNIRFDHLAIFFAFFTIPLSLKNFNDLVPHKYISVFIMLIAFGALATLGVSIFNGRLVGASAFIALMRLFMPVLISTTFALVSTKFSINELKNAQLSIFDWIILSACIGTFISITTVFYSPSWMQSLITGFRDKTLWHDAFSLGRYTGIFFQPLEAGIFYSIALITLNYSFVTTKSKKLNYIILTLIISLGGMLSLSKNFYILGYFATPLLMVLFGWRQLMVFILINLPIAIITGLTAFSLASESYLFANKDLFFSNGIFAFLSGGRFAFSLQGIKQIGGNESVVSKWHEFFSHGLLFGTGLGNRVPYDNAFLEYALQGGTLAVLSYLCCLLFLVIVGSKFIKNDSGKLLFTLGVFTILSSIGSPVLTANRANISLIAIIITSLGLIAKTEKSTLN